MVAVSTHASAQSGGNGSSRADAVAAYWTPERIASAQPRDLVVDGNGLGYLRRSDGGLTPYGHGKPARLTQLPATSPGSPVPAARPGGGGDTAGPSVTVLEPLNGATVGAEVAFAATVTDDSGIRSVSFVIVYPNGTQSQSFTPNASGDTYSTTLTGFTDGDWSWYVVAKDGAGRGGNTTTTQPTSFTVDTGVPPPPPPSGDDVANDRWPYGGDIQGAEGRILFEMPTIKGKRVTWNAYVCSGTTVQDDNSGASIILTAAHCAYDDVAKEFARNVLFIPNQDATSGTGTDTNCNNDPIGCWAPSYAVVDGNWTTRSFPDNVEWDYAYYVVQPTSHTGAGGWTSLEDAVNELPIGFSAGAAGGRTYALGYSYSDDPYFMYCTETMQDEGNGVNWWLPNCDLSGGSSGGAWVQPMDTATGSGPIISVNSWGYTNSPGMAGPFLDRSAECVFGAANDETLIPTNRGIVVGGCTD